MKTCEIIEYTCTECNSNVKEVDKVCPNCGADLAEEFVPTKFTKAKHRIIFYIIIFPALFVFTFLITHVIDLLSESYLSDYNIINVKLSFAVLIILVILSNILFAFLFINQTNTKRIIISASVSAILIILYLLFLHFNIQIADSLFYIVLNELAIKKFNKPAENKILKTGLIAISLFSLYYVANSFVEIYNTSKVHIMLKVNTIEFIINMARNKDERFYSNIKEINSQLQLNHDADVFEIFQKNFHEKNILLTDYFIFNQNSKSDIVSNLKDILNKSLENDVNVFRNRLKLVGADEITVKRQNPENISVTMAFKPGNKTGINIGQLLQDSSLVEFRLLKDSEETILIMKKIDSVMALNLSATQNTNKETSEEEFSLNHPFFSIAIVNPVNSNDSQRIIDAFIRGNDKDKLIMHLQKPEIRNIMPNNEEFIMTAKPSLFLEDESYYLMYYVSKAPVFTGEFIVDTKIDVNMLNEPFVSVIINNSETYMEGYRWDNIPNKIILVYKNKVFSYPLEINEMSEGNCKISAIKNIQEAKSIETVIKAGMRTLKYNIIYQENI